MTEEEAKKTICPEMSGYVSAGVEGSVDFYECLCFGSACQWWIEDEWIKTRIKGQEGHFTNEPAGHCGAAK